MALTEMQKEEVLREASEAYQELCRILGWTSLSQGGLSLPGFLTSAVNAIRQEHLELAQALSDLTWKLENREHRIARLERDIAILESEALVDD